MARCLYQVQTGTTFWNSLASPALQTAVHINSTATDFGLQIVKFRLSFNGVTAGNTPVLVRFYTDNGATAGTSTAGTITQSSGRVIAATNITAGYNYTAEPTTKTYLGDEYGLTPNGGTLVYDYPFGDEPDYFNSGNSSFGMEITPAQQVGVKATVWFSRV